MIEGRVRSCITGWERWSIGCWRGLPLFPLVCRTLRKQLKMVKKYYVVLERGSAA